MAESTRRNILITGASSGLGEGMARAFAARGANLALCARRVDRLQALREELSTRYSVAVAVAALDVNEHAQVPRAFEAMANQLGPIDRVVVNAGVAKGAPLGTGKLWANKQTIDTNLVSALVQIEYALEMFRAGNGGHLVLMSSVLSTRGQPGSKAAYSASKAGLRSLGQSLQADFAKSPDSIKVTVIEPGYIESEMTSPHAANTRFMIDAESGVKAIVNAIEREASCVTVPRFPWIPLIRLMHLLPDRLVSRIRL